MSVAEHVHRRGGIYHLRCRVPLDLVSLVGRGEIRRSLATACPKEAKQRANRLYGRLGIIFEGLRRMPESREDWVARLLALGVEEKDKAFADLVALFETTDEALQQERVSREKAEEAARTAIHQYGVVLGELAETVSPEKLTQETKRLEAVKALKKKHDRLKDNETVAQGEAVIAALASRLGLPIRNVSTPKVSDFLKNTYSNEKRLPDDSNRHITHFISMFARITEDKPLAEYKREDVVQYVRTLETLSNSTGKSPSDRTATIEMLVAKSLGKPTMNASTIEKHIQHVKAFFNSARINFKFATSDDIDEMFDGIDFSDFVPLPQKRKSWPIEKLNALFATPIWDGTKSAPDEFTKRNKPGNAIYRDAYWWLPVAALWTGARLEELAQLHHEDLLTENGIPYIRIHDDGIRRVKTENSVRNVPIHSVLVGLGFVDLFDKAKAGQRIWPELLPTGRMKKFGDTYSSHFTDYRQRCGLYERFMDFHSLRRTFITCMRTRANVDAMTVAALAGHDEELPIFEQAAQTDKYTDYGIKPLAEAIERLDFQGYGLDLGLIANGGRDVPPKGAKNPKPREHIEA
jgi:integrase